MAYPDSGSILREDGSAAFVGAVDVPNLKVNLDLSDLANFANGRYTGPSLDVKERIETFQTKIATLEADPTTKSYVDTKLAELIDASPGALNTLNELAAALNDDANFGTTITNAVAAVQADVDQNELDSDAADTALSDRLDVLEADPTTATALAAVQADVDQNESDADAAIALKANTAGDTFTGVVTVEDHLIVDDSNNLATEYNFNVKSSGSSTFGVLGNGSVLLGNSAASPFIASSDHHATSKKYVDDALAVVQADVDQNESDSDAADTALSDRIAVFELDPGPNGATFTEVDTNVDDLVTLSGVSENTTDLGTFVGSTITDNVTVKVALQEVETAVETKLNSSAISAFGLTLVDDADAGTARTTLGLGNVDNTSDVNKPVSTATQTALDLKADSTVVTEIDGNVDDLVTLSGVAENTANLGTFTGSILSDNLTVKGALQEVEDDLAKAIHLDGANMPGPYNNDTDAGTGGVPVGGLYKNSNGTVHWRQT